MKFPAVVFSFLDCREVLRMRSVCRAWKEEIDRCANACLIILSLDGSVTPAADLARFTAKPQFAKRVRSVSFEFCNNLRDEDLRALRALPNLTALNLNACRGITDAGIREITEACVSAPLTSLQLYWDVALTDTSLEYIGAFFARRLTVLNLSGVRHVSETALCRLLAKCGGLTDLNLTRIDKLGDATLAAVGTHCPRLRVLRLYASNGYTDKGLQALCSPAPAPVPKALGSAPSPSPGVPAPSAPSGPVPHLQLLDLTGGGKVTDSGLAALLSRAHSLQWLGLMWCVQVGDLTLKALSAHCPFLETLSIHGLTRVTAEGLTALAQGCGRLRWIDMNGCCAVGLSSDQLAALLPTVHFAPL